MPETLEAPVQNPSSAQNTELCLLVDLEARWENLRVYQPSSPSMASPLKELHQKQKAYEAFFAKLAAYNKVYKPAHVPELLLNNARRLGVWCRRMRDLHLRVQHDSQAHYPVHLLEKAYRWADRVADKLKEDRITRPTLSENILTAIRDLEDLVQWCDKLSPGMSGS
jgi:hypothetical protein